MKSRAKKKWKLNRGIWSLKSQDRRRGLPERYCPECKRPYDVTPRPKADEQLIIRSAAAMVYSTSRYGRTEFAVHFGRWQAYVKDLWLSGLFGPDDLEDLEEVVVMAREYVSHRMSCAPKSGRFAARGQTVVPRW